MKTRIMPRDRIRRRRLEATDLGPETEMESGFEDNTTTNKVKGTSYE